MVLRLDLSENALWGPIAPELGNLTNLEFLDLSDNGLREEIPPELGNLENLEVLILSTNDLRGEIPPELGNLENLEILGLFGNELEGEIPPELGNLHNLKALSLGSNRLGGEIPPELENLENLEFLDLSNNRLEGVVPDFLGGLSNLTALYLAGNTNLNGCLPEGSSISFCTQPGNVKVKLEGQNMVISWDPVEGATHYNIYWEDFFETCEVTSGGATTSWCEELVTNITETTYVHIGNADDDSTYWITACNSDGCSVVTRNDSGASP